MRSKFLAAITAIVGCVLMLVAAVAWAQTKTKFDFGRHEYEVNCANCHGIAGKGDGPYKPYLTKSPSDLTVIAKNNHGVFPYPSVYQMIDGRTEVAAHGPRDMPIWGNDYLTKARSDAMDVPYDDEKYVKTRIDALVEYIAKLQVKVPQG